MSYKVTDKNCVCIITLEPGKRVGIQNEQLLSWNGFISQESTAPIIMHILKDKNALCIRHGILERVKAIKYPVQNTGSVFTLNIWPFFWMFSYS